MKKVKVEIIGFFYREKDGNEYILCSVNGEKYLTNGVCRWNRNIERYVNELNPVKSINMESMVERLEKAYPYWHVTTFIKNMTEQEEAE